VRDEDGDSYDWPLGTDAAYAAAARYQVRWLAIVRCTLSPYREGLRGKRGVGDASPGPMRERGGHVAGWVST
jgi:hypothetical protein